MGAIHYCDSSQAIRVEDRALTHLKMVMVTKLRRNEAFTLTWVTDDLRSTLWIHPSIPLRFVFDETQAARLDAQWVENLMHHLSATGELRIIGETLEIAEGSA